MSRRHVVLVGLPGSGKSTVGLEVARRLHATFTDVDADIARDTGMTIADLWVLRGEAEFRKLEAEAMSRVLAAEPQVVAPGAGWVCQPGNLEFANDRAVLVYLAVAPGVAAGRLAGDSSRPLLAGSSRAGQWTPGGAGAGPGELAGRLAHLLAERHAYYRRARVEVDGSLTPDEVAEAVVAAARRFAGW